jgi:LmbE family N-acetylglucosaminyl deacetylase
MDMKVLVAEQEWLAALANVPLWVPPKRPTIVVSPHPDDETLGAGGLIAYQRLQGVPVWVIAVTDGEAAYKDYDNLGSIRQSEQNQALKQLNVESDKIIRLHLPDSRVSEHECELEETLISLVKTGSLVVAPWKRDFHPDHEACGRAAERLVEIDDVTLVSYVFWTWHHGTTSLVTDQLPRRLQLDQSLQVAKNAALACHQSQLKYDKESPILPEELLGPARRNYEIFFVPGVF